jgi:hypothetical protein
MKARFSSTLARLRSTPIVVLGPQTTRLQSSRRRKRLRRPRDVVSGDEQAYRRSVAVPILSRRGHRRPQRAEDCASLAFAPKSGS